MTVWGTGVADYLRLRRQLGFTLAWDEHLLGQLTVHLDAAGIEHLTTGVMIDWAGQPRPDGGYGASRAATRMRAVRSFAAYLHALDPTHEVPPRGVFSHRASRTTPYIYTPEEVTGLLEAAAGLKRYERSRIFPVVFGLLAATGMRVGELLALDIDEVDLDAGIITVSDPGRCRAVGVGSIVRGHLLSACVARVDADGVGRGDAGPPMVLLSLSVSVARRDSHGNRGLLPLSTSVRFLNFFPCPSP